MAAKMLCTEYGPNAMEWNSDKLHTLTVYLQKNSLATPRIDLDEIPTQTPGSHCQP